jgi:Fic family protein
MNIVHNLLMGYAYESVDWPQYRWDCSRFAAQLADIHFRRGRLIAAIASLSQRAQQKLQLSILTQDVVTSSAIEGERLNEDEVRTSIATHLGFDYSGERPPSRYVDGVVRMQLDGIQFFRAVLNQEKIWGWHAALFPNGHSGDFKIIVGDWRNDADGPMRVVSGAVGNETIHYQAPAAKRVPGEMEIFLNWFEQEKMDPLLKAAVAHLRFVTIHPLEDGNGRVGRAITDMALARGDDTTERYYSVSAQIFADRSGYYKALELAQGPSLEVTPWIEAFLIWVDRALASSEKVLHLVKRKQGVWAAITAKRLNQRQIRVMGDLLDGQDKKITNESYTMIANCSAPTAWRDLADLLEKGVLKLDGNGGRSTSYSLVD